MATDNINALTKKFRADLKQIMPGYKWVVKKPWPGSTVLRAIGTQSRGFNRVSTLYVKCRCGAEYRGVEYTVSSSGYGTRVDYPLLEHTDTTLATALRRLQAYYEAQEMAYRALKQALQNGREPK